MKFLIKLILLPIFVALFVSAYFVLTQNSMIFPGMSRNVSSLKIPENVDQEWITTEDGEKLEVWILKGKSSLPLSGYSATLLHGNGDTIHSVFWVQEWLASLGITSYSFDYRGYGNSSGSPSEKGLYTDASAVWKLHKEKENSDKTIIMGISIGTGIASELASKQDSKALILVSPYANFKELVIENSIFGILADFLWYEIPTTDYISRVSERCLIVAHGEKDTIIPFTHGGRVANSFKYSHKLSSIYDKNAGHNDILWINKERVQAKLENCLLK